ncbi:hypothetical protein JW796_01740 [Candidatus Dojkabacteria bacterium]|nr:hypothetical protein [Candidatus Dojkabacteria bacterium]
MSETSSPDNYILDIFPDLELGYAGSISPVSKETVQAYESGKPGNEREINKGTIRIDISTLLNLDNNQLVTFKAMFRKFAIEVANTNGLIVSKNLSSLIEEGEMNLIDHELAHIREAQSLLDIRNHEYKNSIEFVFVLEGLDNSKLSLEAFVSPVPEPYVNEVLENKYVAAKIALAPHTLSQRDKYSVLWAINELVKSGQKEMAMELWGEVCVKDNYKNDLASFLLGCRKVQDFLFENYERFFPISECSPMETSV